jgi:hypothetical protein
MATLQATTINGTLTVNSGSITASGSSLNSIPGSAFNGGAVTNAKIANTTLDYTKFGFAGHVVQTLVNRYDPRPGWSAPTSTGGGTLVTSNRLTITPKYSNSLIICEWRMHGEGGSHDQGFRVARNGSVITSGAYAGINTDTGNNNHSFIESSWYDADDNSTPMICAFLYYDVPGSTATVYYDPVVASTDGGTRTYFQNRPIGSGGQNNHENGISIGRITEIRQ